MKTTYKFLKTGELVMENRPSDYYEAELVDGFELDIEEGECLAVAILQKLSSHEIKIMFSTDPKGFFGKSNPKIKRLHGWRGTTDNWRTTGWGWRTVLESRPVKRGIGWRVKFSKDLLPDQP